MLERSFGVLHCKYQIMKIAPYTLTDECPEGKDLLASRMKYGRSSVLVHVYCAMYLKRRFQFSVFPKSTGNSFNLLASLANHIRSTRVQKMRPMLTSEDLQPDRKKTQFQRSSPNFPNPQKPHLQHVNHQQLQKQPPAILLEPEPSLPPRGRTP